MAVNKTVETNNGVDAYLQLIVDEKKRRDCNAIIQLITKETNMKPKMWGTGIVGFGSYHYKYESGHEGDAPLAGLAARSNAITLYLSCETEEKTLLLQDLGKHKAGKGCIDIKKLSDIDTQVLLKLVNCSINFLAGKYPANKK